MNFSEAGEAVQVHAAGEWQSWTLSPDCPDCKAHILTLRPHCLYSPILSIPVMIPESPKFFSTLSVEPWLVPTNSPGLDTNPWPESALSWHPQSHCPPHCVTLVYTRISWAHIKGYEHFAVPVGFGYWPLASASPQAFLTRKWGQFLASACHHQLHASVAPWTLDLTEFLLASSSHLLLRVCVVYNPNVYRDSTCHPSLNIIFSSRYPTNSITKPISKTFLHLYPQYIYTLNYI